MAVQKPNQVGKQNQGKFKDMVVVIPRTNEGYKEIFAVSGNKKIPFGVPVTLTDKDKAQILNQKEAIKSGGIVNPYEMAKQQGITIQEAMERMSQMGDAVSSADEIQWMNKYQIVDA